MIWQARAYIAVMALRYGGLAVAALAFRSRLLTPTLNHPIPLCMWGWGFLLMAGAALFVATKPTETRFRFLVVGSVFVTLLFASRLLTGFAIGDLRFFMGPWLSFVISLKDLSMVGLQVRMPIKETLVQAADR